MEFKYAPMFQLGKDETAYSKQMSASSLYCLMVSLKPHA